MTDEKIEYRTVSQCISSDYAKGYNDAAKTANDIIKREQRKSEAYKHYYDECLKDLKKAHSEIERYEKENRENFDKWKILDKRTKERYSELYEEAKKILKTQARAEAVREFAEKLKEKATSTFYEERKYVDTEDIDELVREMTEKEGGKG